MKNETLIKVFEDTMKLVEDGAIETNSSTLKCDFSDINSEEETETPNIIVSPLDSVSYIKENIEGKTCILNMASYKRGGGGVRNGSNAQEECLFRCSNLFETVDQKFYPLKEDECLYTKDAVFFKDFYYNRMDPVIVDVVTIAAINLNKDSYYDFGANRWVDILEDKDDNYINHTKDKIRLMLSVAEKNNVNTLVLGAWGCGVFKNDPTEMAEMFKQVLIDEKYATKFKKVVFAIINDQNSVDDNYSKFSEVLN